MKKLYSSGRVRVRKRSKAKGAVHPIVTDHLAFLPATLAAALSAQDREVLAYLISYNKTKGCDQDHAPLFSCRCFRCYMSYWARWDSSPNQNLIHQIIDSLEHNLQPNPNKKPTTKAPASDSVKDYESTSTGDHELELELGSMTNIVNFIGDKIWGALGR